MCAVGPFGESFIVATAHWELFPHPADIGIRGIGPTREAAFAQAATALTAVITDPEHLTEVVTKGTGGTFIVRD